MDGAEVHIWGTDPNDADTDDDGVSDYDEIYVHHTDPGLRQQDGDYVDDGEEADVGLESARPGHRRRRHPGR